MMQTKIIVKLKGEHYIRPVPNLDFVVEYVFCPHPLITYN